MEKYYIWLLGVMGEAEPAINELLGRFGSPEDVYNAYNENIALLGAEANLRAEKFTLKNAKTELDRIKELGVTIVTRDDPLYPARFRRMKNPPCVLFAKGDTELLKRRLVTIVGTRSISPYTETVIPRLVSELPGDTAIVSTLSEGSDQLTALSALRSGVPFIECMPCGHMNYYPKGSRTLHRYIEGNGGLTISEFLPRIKASNPGFHKRSRILGGISYVTIVTQAGMESGTLLTAEYSPAPLFVPPNDIFDRQYAGAVSAIRGGAKAFVGSRSLEKAFERAYKAESEGKLTAEPYYTLRNVKHKIIEPRDEEHRPRLRHSYAEEQLREYEDAAETADTAEVAAEAAAPAEMSDTDAVLEAIRSAGQAVGAEEIIAKTGIRPEKIAEILLDLEIEGRVKTIGSRYTV